MITDNLYVASVMKLDTQGSIACPHIECRICKQKRHMSYVCDRKSNQESSEVSAEDASTSLNEIGSAAEADPNTSEKPVGVSTVNVHNEISRVVREDQGRNRSCPMESHYDTKRPTRRSKYHPVPNIEIARERDKSIAKKQSAS